MRFFQNARVKGKNSFLDFIFTVVITILFYFITSLPFIIYSLFSGFSDLEAQAYQGPVAFALMLFIFSGIFFGILVATRRIHHRPILSVLTGADSFRWRHLIRAGGLWFVILAAMEIVGYIAEPELYTFQFDLIPFISILSVAIVVLPFQTSAEEVMMRGYLMQQIGLIARYPWIPILITSIFFGALHGGNPEVLQYGLAKSMTLYIGMGLFFGIATIMDDGLEIPLGVHYVNNFFAFVLVGYKGSVFEGVPTLLLKESEDLTWGAVLSNIVVMVVVLFIFKRYFRWPSFNYLLGRIRGSHSSVL